MGGRLLAVVAVATVALGASRAALAQRAIITDLASEADLREEAEAVSMLIASAIRPASRAIVPRDEVGLGLEVVMGPGQASLSIDATHGPALMEKLKADRLFFGTLRLDGARLRVSAQVLGLRGRSLAGVEVASPRGDIRDLAAQVAARIGPRMDATVAELPQASLRRIRPYVAASAALRANDAKTAAEQLELAGPGSAVGIPSAEQVALSVWQNPAAPIPARITAALAANKPEDAANIAEQALKRDPNNVAARAGKARALTALGKFAEADKELATLKPATRTDPYVAIARADLAITRKDSPEKRDAALEGLIGKPQQASLLKSVLAFVASTPPNTFGVKVERFTANTAQQLSAKDPALASTVAFRAIQGGVEVERSLTMVRSRDLAGDELATIRAKVDKLAAAGGPAAIKLQGEITARAKVAQEIRLGALGAAQDPTVLPLVNALRPFLQTFAKLTSPGAGRVAMIPLKASSLSHLFPYGPDANRLRDGLAATLAGAPFELSVVATPPGTAAIDIAATTEDLLASVASQASADLLVLYRLQTSGSQAEIELVVFDAYERKLFRNQDVLEGKATGLVQLQPIPIATGVFLVAVIGGLLVLMLTRGRAVIQIRRLTGGAEDVLCVEISRSPQPPVVRDPEAFVAETRRNGASTTSRVATLVKRDARFKGLTPGRWFVHLYGVTWKGNKFNLVTGDAYSRAIRIRARDTAYLTFSLEGNLAEFMVNVTDDGIPVSGARVWLNDDEMHAVRTGREGVAVLTPSRGKHVIHIETHGMHITRAYEVIKPTLRTFEIKLDWERRVDDVSRALEPEGAPPAEFEPVAADPAVSVDDSPDNIINFPTAASPRMAPGLAATAASILPGAQSVTPGSEAPRRVIGVGGPAPARHLTPISTGAGLGRYQMVTELGRGAMGVVYKARDLVLDREVALKIMAPEIRDNQEIAAKFVGEARALAALNHPNIVTVYDQGHDQGEMFIVMEFVEGITLDSLLETNGPLPASQAVELIDQLCAGMAYAHSKRIIHRDIKPSNVFLSTAGMVKIGDFGLAKAMQSLRISRTQVQGTPLYMSPEQILGRDIDFRADIYAIGCTFFELLTGKPPFTEGEVMYHHVHSPCPAPSELAPNVPTAVDEVVLSCLVKDKESRIPSAEHIRAVLRTLRG